jgi:integrase
MTEKIPFSRRPKHLPTVLSKEEIKTATQSRVSSQTPCPSDDALWCGPARIGGLPPRHRRYRQQPHGHSRSSSQEKKDRDVMLSPVLLETLRQYRKGSRSKPWLFPGYGPDKPINTKSVFLMVQSVAAKAKIAKTVSPHTLRHYAASRDYAAS